MSTEELVIKKLQNLNTVQQQQVLEFIDSLPKSQESAQAEPSPFGKKLRELRDEIVASGIPLLNDDELDREIAERRSSVHPEQYDDPKAAFSTFLAELKQCSFRRDKPIRQNTKGKDLAKFVGTWQGDDLEECLRFVKETRSQSEF